jgi:hypothetical protein
MFNLEQSWESGVVLLTQEPLMLLLMHISLQEEEVTDLIHLQLQLYDFSQQNSTNL